jgi:hypothetical protein
MGNASFSVQMRGPKDLSRSKGALLAGLISGGRGDDHDRRSVDGLCDPSTRWPLVLAGKAVQSGGRERGTDRIGAAGR